MNSDQTYFLAFCHQIVDCLTSSFGYRPHRYNYTIGILGSIIVEQMIITTSNLIDFLHIVFYDSRNGFIKFIGSLTMLKEGIGILGHTPHNRSLGIQCSCTELGQSLLIDKRS